MKLLPIDIILVIIIILLLFIIYYFSSKLNDDSRIYNRNSILTQICRKDHNIDNNPNYTFRLLLNEKLYVKEFNQKNFPDMNYAKNLFIFEDPNYLYQIQNKLPEKYVVKYSTGTGTNIIVDTQIQIKDIVNKCEVIQKDIKDTYNHPKDSKTYLIISKIRKSCPPAFSPSSREHTCSCAVSKFVALGMSNFVSVRVRRTYQFRAFVCGVESQTWKRSFGKIWWRGLEDWWRYVNSE